MLREQGDIAGSKTMVQNEMPVVPECFLASGRTHGEEQKNTCVTIQTMSKHFVSSLNSRQAVHKHLT